MNKLNLALEHAISEASKIKEVSEIWLYGSYSRGDFSPLSDVDLLIVIDSENNALKRKLRVDCVSEESNVPEADVHFSSISPNLMTEFKGRECFYRNIKKEGRIIWARA